MYTSCTYIYIYICTYIHTYIHTSPALRRRSEPRAAVGLDRVRNESWGIEDDRIPVLV